MAPGKPPKSEAPGAVELLGDEREEKPGAAAVASASASASADTNEKQMSPSEGLVDAIDVKRECAACFGTTVSEAQGKPKHANGINHELVKLKYAAEIMSYSEQDPAAVGKAREQLHEMSSSSTCATGDIIAEGPGAVELLGVEREEKPSLVAVVSASADTNEKQTSSSERLVYAIDVKREGAACFGTTLSEAQGKPKHANGINHKLVKLKYAAEIMSYSEQDPAAVGKAREQLHEMSSSSTCATGDIIAEGPGAVELLGVEREEKPSLVAVVSASADTNEKQTSSSERLVYAIDVKREGAACFGTTVSEAQGKPKHANGINHELVKLKYAAELMSYSEQDPAVVGKAREQLHEMSSSSTCATGDIIAEKPIRRNLKYKVGCDDSKSPLLKAAKIEASEAKAMVQQLRIASEKLKSETIKPMPKLTKVARWTSESTDRRVLTEYLEALDEISSKNNCCGAIPPLPPLACFSVCSSRNVNPAYLSERPQRVKPGIDLVMIKGSFAVPSSYASGNCYIDRMNIVLFRLYMSINSLLEGVEAAEDFPVTRLQAPEADNFRADSQAAICELRRAGHSVRTSIVEAGGLSIREPALYWRKAFPDAML